MEVEVALDDVDVGAVGEVREHGIADPQLRAVQRVGDADGAHVRRVEHPGPAQAQLPGVPVVVGNDGQLAAQQEAGGDDVGRA